MSLFGILSLGGQALLTGKRSIDITSENIANQYTDGYARQVVYQQDLPPHSVFVKDIERIMSDNLFNRAVDVRQKVSYGETYSDVLSQIEALFNDVHGTGFSEQLNNFFNSFNDVAINPDDISARDAVIASAKELIARIRTNYDNMVKIREENKLAIKDRINKINDILDKLANVNVNIRAFSNDKIRLNNYLSQRDLLLKDLSTYVDVKLRYNQDGTVDAFTTKGHKLLLYDKYSTFSAEEEPEGFRVRLDGVDLTDLLQNGELGGYLRAIDFINERISDLNDFTSMFTALVNKIHRQGYDLDGNTGIDFFKIDPASSSNKLDASNIALNINDPRQIAAASDSQYLTADNEVVKGIIKLKDYNEISTKTTSTAVSNTTTFTAGSFDLYLDGTKLATISYSGSDTIIDIANAINSAQKRVVAQVYESPAGSYYIQLFAKDINLSSSIEIRNDTGTFSSTVGGLQDISGFFNPQEENDIKSGNLTIGGTKYSINSANNLTILKTKSLSELYNLSFTTKIGFEIQTTKDALEDNNLFLQSLEEKLAELSGVNLDEELTNMLKYQRAYQSAAKIINVTDELLQTILGLVK